MDTHSELDHPSSSPKYWWSFGHIHPEVSSIFIHMIFSRYMDRLINRKTTKQHSLQAHGKQFNTGLANPFPTPPSFLSLPLFPLHSSRALILPCILNTAVGF